MAEHSYESPRRKASPIPADVDSVLREPGAPLEPTTRAELEPRFQHDFSRVRVHTDPRAAASAQAHGARAYTVGSHIAFGPGGYAPHTTEGRQAIAHELAHVVQQSRGGATAPAALEHDAHQAADAALTGGAINVRGGSAPALAKLDAHGAPEPAQAAPDQEAKDTLVAAIESLGGPSYRADTMTIEQLCQVGAQLLARRHNTNAADFDPKQQLIKAIEALGGPSYSPEQMSEQDLRREWVRLSQESFNRAEQRAEHPQSGPMEARQLSKADAERIHQQDVERRQNEYDLNRLTPYTDMVHAASLNAAGSTGFRMGPFGSIAFDLFLLHGDDPRTAQQKAANVDAAAALAPAVTRGGQTTNVGNSVAEPESTPVISEPLQAAKPAAAPANPAPAAAPQHPPSEGGAVWAMGAGPRGQAIESANAKQYARMGPVRRMPNSMPGVDFTMGGTTTVQRDAKGRRTGEVIEGATILQEKSVDLRGKVASTTNGFVKTITKSIEAVYQVNTVSRNGITVTEPADRILNVYYGPGDLTPAQQAGLPAIVEYAKDRNVAVNLVRH